ncbi:MAG: DUF6941 family protein [Candidatus Dormibacteria bacterium]
MAKSELSETGVDFLLLSDAAQVSPDGKLHLIGGGLAWVVRAVPSSPDVPPPPTSFAIVVSFRIGWNDTNIEFPLSISISNLDETDKLVEVTANVTAGRPPQLSAGDSVHVPMAVPVLAQFPKAGHYVVRASLKYAANDERDRSVRFTVVDAPLPVAPPKT